MATVGPLSYTTGVPNPPNAPSVDVPNMQTNTNSLQTFLQYDHVAFNQTAAGAHLQLNLMETNLVGTPTLPSTLAGTGFGTLYSTTNSNQIAGNAGEIYYTRGGSGVQIQLTGPGTPTPTAVLNPAWNLASAGSTFLAGGILMQWGLTNAIGAGLSVTFPIAFRNLLSLVSGTNANGGRFFTFSTASNTGFTVISSSGSSSTGAYWIAIGN